MKVRELLTDSSKWMQWGLAKDAKGKRVNPKQDFAQSFCLVGAIMHCYPESGFAEAMTKVRMRINRERPEPLSITFWNDESSRKFEEVKALVEELDI